MNRRNFLRIMGMAGVAAALPWKFNLRKFRFQAARAYAFAQSPILTKFVDSLPGLTLAGANNLGQYLTVMTPNDPGNLYPGSDYYQVVASPFTQQVHTSLPATTFWGYAQDGGTGDLAQKYLGGVIVANADKPVRLTMRNALPATHVLPVDMTLMGANGSPGGTATGVNRLSTHLHGGFPRGSVTAPPSRTSIPTAATASAALFPRTCRRP